MLTCNKPQVRVILTVLAAGGWLVALVLTDVWIRTGGTWEPARPLALLTLAIAATSTIVLVVGKTQVPIEAAYRVGYDAGFADGERSARPIAPVIDLRDRLADH